MRSGSRAPAIPVLRSTPSQPSSMASATSLAVPTPASMITGYAGSSPFRSSRMIRMLFGFSTPCPLPIGLPAGITLVAPACLEPAGHDRVVAGVAEHLEPLLDQHLGRFERGQRVGQERARVGQDFELDPVGAGVVQPFEQLAAEPGGPQRVLGGEAARGVGQDRVPPRVEEVEQVPPLAIEQPLAADGDRDDLGAAGVEAVAHQLERGVLARPHQQPALDRVGADRERLDRARRHRCAAADERDDLEHVARATRASRRAGRA